MKLKKIKLALYISSCYMLASTFSCSKSNDKEKISATKTYTGVIVGKDCPSYAFIKVTNANIGENFTTDSTYSHVIGISNCPDNITNKAKVSFRISTTTNYRDCIAHSPCLMVVFYASYPKEIYCTNMISTEK